MNLNTLLTQTKAELLKLAKTREIKRRSALSKEDLIIALAEEPLSQEAQRIIRLSSAELYELAKERDIEGRGQMTKDQLIMALLPEDSEETGECVVKVYYPPNAPYIISAGEVIFKGELVGYCWPADRAAVYTYLNGPEKTLPERLKSVAQKSPGAADVLRRVMQHPPPGAEVKNPPL